ncbi:MAG: nitrous oxide reductase accessory protein NosL [Candidatus Cyclobacteriaceae bacterium M2_1C_046]
MKSRLPQIVMIIAALSLIGVFFFPLWKITLYAPQYTEGINMYIWVNQITGDTPYTLQNINILNHYIGMQYIEPDSIPELTYFPYIVGTMIFLGLVAAFTRNKIAFFSWAGILLVLGALGLYDFYLWNYDYGHNLDPNAPIKVPGMTYQPPIIGSKMLLNFDAQSWPQAGSLFLGIAMALGVVAGMLKNKQEKKSIASGSHTTGTKKVAFAGVFALLIMSSCSTGPKTIYYGEENCHFCQMTIVDQRYAAQIITDKGKDFNFDAIECMLHFEEEEEIEKDNIAGRYINTFDNPGKLIEISKVTFVQTPELPSPMGMNLTGFVDGKNIPTVGNNMKKFTWTELNEQFGDMSNNLVNLK